MDLGVVFVWYITVSFAGLLVLPLAFYLFNDLPERGLFFIKPLGLLLIGFVYWLLGSLNVLSNDNGGLLLAVLIVLGAEILLVKKQGLLEFKNWLSKQTGLLLAGEILFLAAFVGWAWIRAHNPNIEGTEKPMEYMFINSILKSPAFPLQDAWLSDHSISYYYFGYLLMALLTRATGTAPQVAFNLGLALIFALTAVASTGMVLNMIALVKGDKTSREAISQPDLMGAFWPALLAPILLLGVNNFYGALEFAHNNALVTQLKVPALYYDFGSAADLGKVRSLQDFEKKPGLQAGMLDFWEWLDLKQLDPLPEARALDEFSLKLPNWFFSARVVHDRNLVGQETEAIDEVPAFSFLLGDMHPHVLALPFGVLSAALAFEWLLLGKKKARLYLQALENKKLESKQEELPDPLSKYRLAVSPEQKELLSDWRRISLSAIVLGGLLVLNTWDYPVYWFLTVLAWAVGLVWELKLKGLVKHWLTVLNFALYLLGGSLIFYLPFYTVFQSQAGGILPNLIYPTRFQQIFVMFGPAMLLVGLFLLAWVWQERRVFKFKWMFSVALSLLLGLGLLAVGLSLVGALNPASFDALAQAVDPLPVNEALGLIVQRRLVDGLTALLAALMIGAVVALVVGKIEEQPRPENPEQSESLGLWMSFLMILVGALLLLGPEFVYLRDNFGSRMNTMFKFYFQVWILWSMAGAFALWYIGRQTRRVFSGVTVVLAIAAIFLGVYGLFGGLLAKADFTSPASLDGMAYFADSSPDDWAAIEWLNQNVKGDTVILEGSRGAYWAEGRSSRISMATGLPTVMGWENHEMQWRGSYFASVAGRGEDIKTIYQSRDWAVTETLLNKYNIQYVIVSPLEANWYRPLMAQKFEQHLSLVFQRGSVKIYKR
jgi:YYY domain-containing protein